MKTRKILTIIGSIILVIGIVVTLFGIINLINNMGFNYIIVAFIGFVLDIVGMSILTTGLTSRIMSYKMKSSLDALSNVSDDAGDFAERMLDRMEPVMKKRAKIVTPIVSEMAGEVAKSVKDAVTEDEEYKFCTNCGQKISTKNKFCNNCGQKTNFK